MTPAEAARDPVTQQDGVTQQDRVSQLAARLAVVEKRIQAACMAADRPREDVHLVVVTKWFPATDLALLAGLGVTDVGESRDQEAAQKIASLEPAARAGLRVHFVGQVQTRKAGSVARYTDVVHSVDRPKLVTALDRAADGGGRDLDVLVQVSLDADPARGGVPATGAADLARAVAGTARLRLRGVMAVAPLGGDPFAAFADLRTVADAIQRVRPEATWISAGMSADLEAAVANGATHLRVGSAILGSRPPLR